VSPSAPLDQLHADCIEATQTIRTEFQLRRELVANWVPRPMPKGWKP